MDIPRTGSTSLKLQLGQSLGQTYAKSDLRIGERHSAVRDHCTALEMRELLGAERWNRLYRFSFVRDPWDRMVSFYLYRRDVARNLPPSVPFDDYVRRLRGPVPAQPKPRSPFFRVVFHRSCSQYLYDADGQLLVNFVGHYERRAQDLALLAEARGLIVDPSLSAYATAAQSSYRSWYTPETAQIVGEFFADDLRNFGYSF
ncbi:MAG TPA: sulfotransferase family 2 domain-containing protein [Nevskiaceae bacterium]|nr:sulfotransferase family 2 domain-containing protein [Nevskiaceae bacterium]